MDNQLHRLLKRVTRPPLTLTDIDLTELARGITAAVRGNAKTRVDASRGRHYVRIYGNGINVLVFAEAWAKIVPYIQDGTFSPLLFPVTAGSQVLDPVTFYDASYNDQRDPLFKRVLGVLQSLFPTKFPT